MAKTATLYRMETPEHICPFGLKTKALLKRKGFEVDDHLLTNRGTTEDFKQQYNVNTTPQTFIAHKRIGGYDQVRKYFGMKAEAQNGFSYIPVIAIFSICFFMACAVAWRTHQTILSLNSLVIFIAFSMCVLALQKLRDLAAFSNQFITYDLLAKRFVRYAYVYPFAEAWSGIGMLAGFSPWLVSPVALFIGVVGAISVFKAVYIDKRQLKCACVGGNSKVPLGFVSLTENLLMVLAAFWMWFSL